MSRNFLSINDVDDAELEQLTRPAFEERRDGPPIAGAMAFLFEQVSLRTMSSFAAAGVSVGLTPIPLTVRGQVSRDRVDFNDEVRQLSLIARCVVARSASPLAPIAHRPGASPVINAGDGSNEHPSQALLDVATMRSFGPLQGRRVTLMGNLRHRVHHSLLMALERLGARARLVSTAGMAMDPKYTSRATEIRVADTGAEVDEALHDADFVYQTPLWHWEAPERDPQTMAAYGLQRERAERVLKTGAKILHPFPRTEELDPDLDGTCFDAYHLQTSMGPAVRRRLLMLLLGDAPARLPAG